MIDNELYCSGCLFKGVVGAVCYVYVDSGYSGVYNDTYWHAYGIMIKFWLGYHCIIKFLGVFVMNCLKKTVTVFFYRYKTF